MIFNEIYSAYYNAVADILARLTEGNTVGCDLSAIVSEHAFGESALTILPSLKSGRWQLVRPDMTTHIAHRPSMPLTDIQKRWLKAISLDPRIALFDISFEDLEDTEPLFTKEDYVIYDKYADGDPFTDERYISHFRTILTAINQGHNLKLEILNRHGERVYVRCIPERLEYSEKDDKFRLVTSGCGFVRSVNLARIQKCKVYYGDDIIRSKGDERKCDTLRLKIKDERNTLERALMHFAHLEKNVERLNENEYVLNMSYDTADTPEMVIRVLSFGPTVEVIAPESFKELIKNKLKDQKRCEFF
ncbi:MAG: WYL domain-containing protein [Clostridia bacterium]|nr:WYL domain-containing protein [Clostridia bacterium]